MNRVVDDGHLTCKSDIVAKKARLVGLYFLI